MVASTCVGDESRRRILHRLEASEQTVCDAAEQSITVVETTGYKALHQRLCCIDGIIVPELLAFPVLVAILLFLIVYQCRLKFGIGLLPLSSPWSKTVLLQQELKEYLL